MDESHRAALEELMAEQRAARAQLARLEQKIERLRELLEKSPATPEPLPPLEKIPLPPPLPVLEKKVAPPSPPEPAEKESLEMQLGTVWLVRAGVLILLTGLVLLGNYAYQNFIGLLGAAGKLSLLALAGAALGGIGAWLERRGDALRNYARVLMAGGCATIYYAAYAAHFVPRLRVIESPLVAGALLLALAAAFVFAAERKRSQTFALGAVLLAYYTSAINPLSGFTLFSNLLLTGAAVFFLLRNRWSALSFASLVGTYASYSYWRFFHENEFSLRVAPHADFWTGALYLLGYWTLFTAGAMISKNALRGSARAVFVSFNNAAFFGLVATTIPQFFPHSFWIFSLAFGAVLLALAAIANTTQRDDPILDATFLAQGLLLVTIGIAAKVTGYQLALVLALESAALITCARARHGWIFELAAGFCASAACALAFQKITQTPTLALPLGSVVCLAFLYDARWLKHLDATARRFHPRAAWFSLLAMLVGFVIVWQEVALPQDRALAFALITVALTFATWLHGLFELALVVQFYNCATVLLWADAIGSARQPTWKNAVLLACAVALQQWWKRQKFAGGFFHPVYCAAGLALFLHWTWDRVPMPQRFVFLTAAAVTLLALAALRKSRTPLVLAIILVVVALNEFWRAEWVHTLVSLDTLAILALLAAQYFTQKNLDSKKYPHSAEVAVAIILLATLWMHVSRWAEGSGREFLLTISWTLLAACVFASGVALRERIQRLAGLVILAAAVARIFIVDVWRLETGYRIVSFILLGVVLLVVGFIYNKLAEKIRIWI